MIKVKVTTDDIARGVPEAATLCPIALALKRATGDTWEVDHLFARKESDYNRAELPQKVVDWIEAYDDERPVTPFEFELAV